MEDIPQAIQYQCLTDRISRLKSLNSQRFSGCQVSQAQILNSPRYKPPKIQNSKKLISKGHQEQKNRQDKYQIIRKSSNLNIKTTNLQVLSPKNHRYNASMNQKEAKIFKKFYNSKITQTGSSNKLMSRRYQQNKREEKLQEMKERMVKVEESYKYQKTQRERLIAGKIYKNIFRA